MQWKSYIVLYYQLSVFISAGNSMDDVAAAGAAKTSHAEDIKIFGIGVGSLTHEDHVQ